MLTSLLLAEAATLFTLVGLLSSEQRPPDRGPALVLQTTGGRDIKALAFSPDGHWLASGTTGGGLTLYEVATGLRIRTYTGPSGDRNHGSSVAFSPDGQMLAETFGKNVKLWNVENGQEVRTFVDLQGPLTFTSDGRRLVGTRQLTGKPGYNVKLVEVATGREIRSRLDSVIVGHVAFSSDARLMASENYYSDAETVKLWDLPTGRELREIHPSIDQYSKKQDCALCFTLSAVTFSADGRWVAVGGLENETVKVWEVATGREVRTLIGRDDGSTSALAFSPDGRCLAIGSTRVLDGGGFESTLTLWDLATGQDARIYTFSGSVAPVAFSQDSRWIASVIMGNNTNIGMLKIWELGTGREVSTSQDLSEWVKAVAFTADGRQLATINWNGSGMVKLWELATTGAPAHTSFGHLDLFEDVALSPDGKWLAFATYDKTVNVWEVATGREVRTYTDLDSFTAVAFSSDGSWLASSISYGPVKIWEMTTGRDVGGFNANETVRALAFSPDRKWLACASGKAVNVWEVATGHKVQSYVGRDFAPDIHDNINSIAFSPDGTWLATGSDDKTVRVWEVATGREARIYFGHTDEVYTVAFGPDGRLLASGSEDQTVRIWGAPTQPRAVTYSAHSDGVNSVAFSPDGRWLASASRDGTTLIWDTATGTEAATLVSFGEGADWLVVSPDGFFDGTADAMKQVAWRVGSANEIHALDGFFTDFYRPGLLAEIIAGGKPKPPVDIATALQIPGLRAMLSENLAHLENHGGRPVVCFEQKPGVAINVGPTDQRLLFPPVNGYESGNSSTCRFQKPLSTTRASSKQIKLLQNWKPEVFKTAWDGRLSDTTHSTLHVLTIGISQYPLDSGFDPLPYAVPSAKAIETFFREQQSNPSKPYARVRVWNGLYDPDATRDKLRQRWSEMAKEVGEDDVVLLYLAGHGKVSMGEEMFYFVPVDGRDSELRRTAVNTAIIAEAVRNLAARRIVLIVDACQSGGAIEALSKIGVVKAQVEQRRAQQEIAITGHEHGMGVHLIAATLPLSYAVGLIGGKSVLADTLLKVLGQGTGTITIDQLASYVRDHLPEFSEEVTHGFRQIPLTESIGLDFPMAAK